MSADNGSNGNSAQEARRARHARRVSYRGSDDYVLTTVGAPETIPFESDADLSGFDRLVAEHAPQELTVEQVGTADPFEAQPPENYTRPFTTAFPDAMPPATGQPRGYSTFGNVASAEVVGARSGHTAVQEPIRVEQVGERSGSSRGRSAASDAPHGKRGSDAALHHGSGSGAGDGAGEANGGDGGKRAGKPRKGLKIFLIILLAIVVIGAGVFIWYTSTLDSRLSQAEGQSASNTLATASLDKPFYMLVMGADTRGVSADASPDDLGYAFTDVMILTRIDPVNHVVTMVSIPRDTPYVWPDGSVTKINECFAKGGVSAAVQAVSELTGVDISHYVLVNFAQLEEIVDAIGGVKVYVDIPMSYQDAITGEMVEVPQGEQTLNGKEAQIFARIRKDYEEGDAKRQSNVRQLGEAIIDTVMGKPAVEIPGTILAMAPYISTNLRSGDFISLAMAFGGGSGGVTMYNGSGPTEGGLIDEYGGYWYCYPNPEGWARLMEVVDSGGDPSTVTF